MAARNLDRVPHDVLIRLQALQVSLKRAERRAADYLLAHPDKVSGITIVELANRCGASEATIVRLSKKLGFEGFPELKASFGSVDEGEKHFEYEGILSSDDTMTVVRKVFDATRDAIRDTLGVLEAESYQKALHALLQARRIVFCGLGDASAVALEAYSRFTRIGEQCLFSEDPDQQLIQAAHMEKGDVLLAISHTGRSRTVLDCVRRGKKMGATILLITNFPVSPLAKQADVVLLTSAFSTQELTGEVMSKRVTELCIVESLYINYLMRKGRTALKKLKISNESVRVNKI
jgi:RpiR family transcriptional regulator, carbohydrate utilization regulator